MPAYVSSTTGRATLSLMSASRRWPPGTAENLSTFTKAIYAVPKCRSYNMRRELSRENCKSQSTHNNFCQLPLVPYPGRSIIIFLAPNTTTLICGRPVVSAVTVGEMLLRSARSEQVKTPHLVNQIQAPDQEISSPPVRA